MTTQEPVPTSASVTAHTAELFGSSEAAERWLQEPQPVLGGKTPLELLDTDEGAQMVSDLLGRIEHGVFS